jgi:hypothetical protein
MTNTTTVRCRIRFLNGALEGLEIEDRIMPSLAKVGKVVNVTGTRTRYEVVEVL